MDTALHPISSPQRDSSILRPWRSRKRLVALAATAVLLMLVLHTFAALLCYEIKCFRLKIIAVNAVKAGARYLPAEPERAVQIADAAARFSGLRAEQIVSIRVSADSRTITIAVTDEVPAYMFFLTVGLPSRVIRVRASGSKHKAPTLARANVSEDWR